MAKYMVKKALRLIVVLLGVSILTFVLSSYIQGNPAEVVMAQTGIEPTLEDIRALEIEMGLDKSLGERYFKWFKSVIKLDFGTSYITDKPVMEEIFYRVPHTLTLTLVSFFVMLLISIFFGIACAIKGDGLFTGAVDLITFVLMGVPGFVFAMVLAYVFSVRLKVLPMVGNGSVYHYIMPVIALSLPMACRYIRIIKGNLLAVLDEDYIFFLRTKGIRENVIMFSNALKNAFIPVVNLMGISFGNLFGGSIVIESIFSWQGLGSYLVMSINNRDYPVILAYVIIMATVFVALNYVVDVIVCLLDPRIKLAGGDNNV